VLRLTGLFTVMDTQLEFRKVESTLKQGKYMTWLKDDGIYIRLAGDENKKEIFSLDWHKIHSFGNKTNAKSFAELELDILDKSWDRSKPDTCPLVLEFRDEIIALCNKFGQSGQSGGSAPYVAGAIASTVKKLLLFTPIAPITGIPDEWVDVGKYSNDKLPMYQNNRCSAIFKDGEDNSGAYYLDAIVWKGDTPGESGNDWDTFTGKVEGISSLQFIKEFPFTPKTFYIDVTREMLPADWTEGSYFENEFYNTKVFEETGIREWFKEKYRYVIKDKRQLDRVWNYYKKPSSISDK